MNEGGVERWIRVWVAESPPSWSARLTLFGAGAVVASFLQVGELGYAGFGFVGLSFAVAIAVAVYAFGPVSGAHINPTVTVVQPSRAEPTDQ